MIRIAARFILACTVIFKVQSVFATGCPAVFDLPWQNAMMATETSVSTAITSAGESIKTSREGNAGQVESALKVLTAQIQAMGDAQAQTVLKTNQSIADHMVAVSQYKQQTLRGIEYSTGDGVTDINGQAFDPCGETARSTALSTSISAANDAMGEKLLRELDAAPGIIVKDTKVVTSRRISQAKTTYCTQDEAASGYCRSPGPMAGKDVDVANFYTSAPINGDATAAKNALLNNLYGIPAQAPASTVVKAGVGQNFFAAKRHDDAVRSVGQNSMKSIQSWTETRGDNPSVIDAISQKVGTYAGGDNFEAWAKAKALQSEHGLLVDYAKMKAFELSMRNLEYQQMERMEALLAAQLAARAARMGTGGGSQPVSAGVARVKQ